MFCCGVADYFFYDKFLSKDSEYYFMKGLIIFLIAVSIFGLFACSIQEDVKFVAKVDRTDNNITFRFIPQNVNESNYFIVYAIGEDTATLHYERKNMENVSAENPIRLIIMPYNSNSTYSVSMEIKDETGDVVYSGQVYS
jgi:hypothetical protein